MGLLTDPSTGDGIFTHYLIKYNNAASFFLYIVAVVWFCLLAHDNFNAGTYFSENALLPGLVKGDYSEDEIAKNFLSELTNEVENNNGQMPIPYLMARFHQLGLEAYIHNFTLHYPLGKPVDMTGRNVYAILRAPRTASMESLVLNIPYRPLESIYPATLPGLALAMSMAKFFRRQKYWAKDIIFLISEHEQLGAQAWLEAYHGVSSGMGGVLESGDLEARGGAIQSAVTLEIQSHRIEYIDVKVSGLNGQLPNLDLVNLIHRLCGKEGVKHTFFNVEAKSFKKPSDVYVQKLITLMSMVGTQATGVPNGNHGLFHRFGIEAVTLEGVKSKKNTAGARFFQMGKVIEGIFRSMNNLLERFHQSYFFYLLPSSDRFVSISFYMPCLALLASTVLLKAYSSWIGLHAKYTSYMLNENVKGQDDIKIEEPLESLHLIRVGLIFLLTHGVGLAMMSASPYMTQNIPGQTDESLFLGYVVTSTVLVLCTVVYKFLFTSGKDWSFHFIFCRVELGLAVMCVGMQNFSLGLITAAIYVLPTHFVSNSKNTLLSKLVWLLFQPLVVLYVILLISTHIHFPELDFTTLLHRSLQVTKTTLVYSLVDTMIYGSWAFRICTLVLFPNWLMFWIGIVLS